MPMNGETERLPDGLRITRTFDAPRSLVFEAWTQPERLQAWWGCKDATSVRSFVDLRVGGEYRHVFEIKGHGEFDMVGHFTIYDPPAHLAWTVPGGEGMPTTHTDVTFEELDQQTRLCLTVTGLDAEQMCDIVTEGWTHSLQKLNKVVTAMQETEL